MNDNRVHVGQKVVILASGPDLGRTANVVYKLFGFCLLDVDRPSRLDPPVFNHHYWNAMLRTEVSSLVPHGRELVLDQKVLMPIPDGPVTCGKFYIRGNTLYAMGDQVRNGMCLMWMVVGMEATDRWAIARVDSDGQPDYLIDDRGTMPIPLIKATTADMAQLAYGEEKDRLVSKIISSPLHDLDIEVLQGFCDAIDEL